MRYAYLVVEGPHDVEFVGRILRHFGLRRIQKFSLADPFWLPLIPRSFPPNDDLLGRVPVPTFYGGKDLSVAISSAIGDTRLMGTVQETLALVTGLESIGLLLDADMAKAPDARFGDVAKGLADQCGLPAPSVPGQVESGRPRVGVYVLPDNQAAGTLEDILLECAGVAYPNLLAGATSYVSGVDRSVLDKKDLADLVKPAGRNKAVVGCIGSFVRPGKSIQVSIHDNRWIEGPTLQLPRVAGVVKFLADLLGLPVPAP